MTTNEIRKRLQELGLSDLYGFKRELRTLPSVLSYDEVIYAMTSGLFEGSRWSVFVTDQRIILISSHIVSGVGVKYLNRSDVHDISVKRGFLFGSLAFLVGDTPIEIAHVAKRSIDLFVWALER